MKKFFYASIIFVFLNIFLQEQTACAQSLLYKNFCEQKKQDIDIKFESSYGYLTYNNSKDSAHLASIDENKNHNGKVLGLTVPDPTVEINVGTQVYDFGEYACIVPAKVDVFFGYENPIIYISREIRGNQCRREQVLRHEQTHHQINILALEYFLPQMKNLITKEINDLQPILINKNEEKLDGQTDKIKDKLVQRMTSLVEQFSKFLVMEQKKLDNDENYQFESTICDD